MMTLKPSKIKNIFIFALLVAFALFFIMPVYFTIINSFKPLREIVLTQVFQKLFIWVII
jgi:ABC-type glycerol-3-phosphate transport system permease component